MSGTDTLTAAIANAHHCDDAWQAHLDAHKIDRWSDKAKGDAGTPLRDLYEAKVLADRIMHGAFEASRAKPAYVETDTETAYGSTQRISRSIRVF